MVNELLALDVMVSVERGKSTSSMVAGCRRAAGISQLTERLIWERGVGTSSASSRRGNRKGVSNSNAQRSE
jgi:hypothetical protein